MALFGKLRSFEKSLKSLTDKCFYSVLFPVFLGLFVLTIRMFSIPLFGLLCISIVSGYVFFSYDDLVPIIPLLLTVIFIFPNFDCVENPLFYCVLIPAAIGFIVSFFRFPFKKIKLGKMFFPFFIVSVALFSGGIFSEYLSYYKTGLISLIAMGPLSLFIYFLFLNKYNPPKDFNFKDYFATTLITITCVAGFQTLFMYFDAFGEKANYLKSQMGWANTNTVGALVITALPEVFYFASKSDKLKMPLFLFALFYLFVFLSRSDACLGIFTAMLPALLVITYFKTDKNKRFVFTQKCALFGILFLTFAIVFISIPFGKEFFKNAKICSSDSGRHTFYKRAWDLFIKNPVFGVGAGYYDDKLLGYSSPLSVFNFHSTLFHVLCTMGIFGLIAYIIYFYKRFNILGKNNSAFNSFMLLSFIMFELYGIVDTCEFGFIPLMVNILFIVLVSEIENNTEKISPLNTIYLDTKKLSAVV